MPMMLVELRLFDHHGHALRLADMITVIIGHSMVVQASPARGRGMALRRRQRDDAQRRALPGAGRARGTCGAWPAGKP